jgi:hypothetical protein
VLVASSEAGRRQIPSVSVATVEAMAVRLVDQHWLAIVRVAKVLAAEGELSVMALEEHAAGG